MIPTLHVSELDSINFFTHDVFFAKKYVYVKFNH